jgi:hypothetical protein
MLIITALACYLGLFTIKSVSPSRKRIKRFRRS